MLEKKILATCKDLTQPNYTNIFPNEFRFKRERKKKTQRISTCRDSSPTRLSRRWPHYLPRVNYAALNDPRPIAPPAPRNQTASAAEIIRPQEEAPRESADVNSQVNIKHPFFCGPFASPPPTPYPPSPTPQHRRGDQLLMGKRLPRPLSPQPPSPPQPSPQPSMSPPFTGLPSATPSPLPAPFPSDPANDILCPMTAKAST